MSTDQKNNEEEVDLGSLFVIIGRGFSNFFNFIGNIFKGIFHALIVTLVFLKLHIVKIGIAAILGGVLGIYLEVKTPERFGSDLLVEPNFKSARQLWKKSPKDIKKYASVHAFGTSPANKFNYLYFF